MSKYYDRVARKCERLPESAEMFARVKIKAWISFQLAEVKVLIIEIPSRQKALERTFINC
jgi:hypothetical protein